MTSKITREHLKNQLDRTSKAIRSATEFSPTTYRPPYGNTNAQINEYIDKEEKMKVIMWSVDTNDWKLPPPEEIAKVGEYCCFLDKYIHVIIIFEILMLYNSSNQ